MLHFYGIKLIFVKATDCKAKNEFSEATAALFIDYSLRFATVIISALQNNSFFGSSPFLSNKWKEETKLSQSVKERERTGERERWFVDFNVVVVTRHCSRSRE